MKIGLIGNQNSGKTTLFNCLTGMNAKIGNWPGVTIEKKTGTIKGTKFELTDLPGIYSLSPYTLEENVSRQFVFDEKPDVIINIIDVNALNIGTVSLAFSVVNAIALYTAVLTVSKSKGESIAVII